MNFLYVKIDDMEKRGEERLRQNDCHLLKVPFSI